MNVFKKIVMSAVFAGVLVAGFGVSNVNAAYDWQEAGENWKKVRAATTMQYADCDLKEEAHNALTAEHEALSRGQEVKFEDLDEDAQADAQVWESEYVRGVRENRVRKNADKVFSRKNLIIVLSAIAVVYCGKQFGFCSQPLCLGNNNPLAFEKNDPELKSHQDAVITELSKQLVNKTNELTSVTKKLENTTQAFEGVASSVVELRNQLETAQANAEALNGELASVQNAADQDASSVVELRGLLEEAQANAEVLNGQLKSVQNDASQIPGLQARINQTEDAIRILEEKLKIAQSNATNNADEALRMMIAHNESLKNNKPLMAKLSSALVGNFRAIGNWFSQGDAGL